MAKKEVNKKEVKTNKKDKNSKNKKTFFKSFKTELKKVVWLTPRQLVNNTVTVLTIVIICAVIVFVLDAIFRTMNTQGIDRIRDAVVTTNNTTDNTNTDENTSETDNTSTNESETTDTNTATEEGTETTTENAETENTNVTE